MLSKLNGVLVSALDIKWQNIRYPFSKQEYKLSILQPSETIDTLENLYVNIKDIKKIIKDIKLSQSFDYDQISLEIILKLPNIVL